MNNTIEINSRFFLATCEHDKTGMSVYDRFDTNENGSPKRIFDNASEKECREWIERNFESDPSPCMGLGMMDVIRDEIIREKLLAFVRKHHVSMPTKESGKLLLEAEGWTTK